MLLPLKGTGHRGEFTGRNWVLCKRNPVLCTVNIQHRLDLYIREWSSEESVVAALIEASLFPVLLLTCSLLIMHLTSLRSCSTVHDSSKQVPGNSCGPKCTWWRFWSVYMHPCVLEHLPKAKWEGPYSEAVCLESQALRQFKALVFVGSLQLHHTEGRRGSLVLIYFICFIM